MAASPHPDPPPAGRPPWHPPASMPEGYEPFPVDAADRSLNDRLRRVAEAHGDRLALRGPAGERTYAGMVERLDRWSTGLLDRLGDRPAGTPVALLARHDLPQLEALLAVTGAGHTALVLDPNAPEGLARALLDDSGAPLVLTDDANRDLAQALAGDRVLDLDELDTLVERPGALPEVDAATPALLAYTSGTSGAPKAAVIPHRQLLHNARGATETLAVRPGDRLPMLFPLSLAVAAYPAVLPLVNGASLHSFDVLGQGFADLPGFIADESITVAYLAPTVVKFLDGSVGDTTFPSLRLVVLGGERVDQGSVALTRSLFGHDALVAVGYGTTETGVLAFWFIDAEQPGEDEFLPAGHPIGGMAVQILDDAGEPVDEGVTGEVVVRSRYLFSGYRGHPELDAQVLSTDPETEQAVYRTGDLGRLRADGALELVGRVDTQVKVRGRRVVLAEVEELLLGLDLVHDGAVVAGADGAGHTVVVAHVVPTDPTVTADAVREAVAAAAPPQMVPGSIVMHEALPHLPNGKLDRQALAGPSPERPRLRTEYVTPAEGLEAEVVALWEELLGVSPVGVDDDFFALGGYSLLAARMLIELEARLGHRIPMAALIDGVTVRGLVEAVAEHEAGRRPASGLVTIQEGDPSRPTLYVAHDLHGSAFRFRHLAAALGEDQPVKGFESPALTGEPFPFTRIETLALRYVTELRRAQPEGPYHLCGYSFGGILAFEMARHLRRAGDEVALLAVVDIGPGYRGLDYDRRRPPRGPWLELPDPPAPDAKALARARHHLGVAAGHPRQFPTYAVFNSRFRQRLLPLGWRLQFRRQGSIPPRHRLWYAYQTHWELVGPSWEGAPYDGDIVLFWSEDTASADATMGWGKLGAEVEIHRIAADHERIMDPDQVHHLAEPLRAVLDRGLQSG